MDRAAFTITTLQSTALRSLNYSPDVDRLRTQRGRSTTLRTLLRELAPAYGTVFTRLDCSAEHGIELMSQSDMFGAEPAGRIIRRDSLADPERHLVRRWQVLIAGAGTLGENELYGRAIIADGRLVNKYVGPDSFSLTFDDEGGDLSLYCYAFLASPLGVRALRSASYGTKILRLREDVIADLPIPLAEPAVVARVADLVRQCVAQREQYAVRIAAAKSVIEDLTEVQEAQEMCGERRARCTIWSGPLPTLRAWTYASPGDALGLLRRKWSGQFADAIEPSGIFHGLLRQRIPCAAPFGVALFSQRDVFSVRRIPRQIAHPGCPAGALFVPPGSLLLASRGQMSDGALFGRVALGDTFDAKCGVTQDILRVIPKAELLGLSYAFLTSRLGQTLVRSTACGTSIPILRIDLLKALPFPSVPDATRASAALAVAEAIEAWNRAAHAEDEAIRILEKEVLPPWLA